MKVTYIKIENGKVWANHLVKPNLDDYYNVEGGCEKAMEKFNQSFVEVSNPDELIGRLYLLDNFIITEKKGELIVLKDGLYAAPEGFVMEVGCKCEVNDLDSKEQCNLICDNKNFAKLSLAPVVGDALKVCNGKIDHMNMCDKCLNPAQSSSAYCTRLIESMPEPKEESTPDHFVDLNNMVPDFEAMAKEACINRDDDGKYYATLEDVKQVFERIWKEHYLPLKERYDFISRNKEEADRLLKEQYQELKESHRRH